MEIVRGTPRPTQATAAQVRAELWPADRPDSRQTGTLTAALESERGGARGRTAVNKKSERAIGCSDPSIHSATSQLLLTDLPTLTWSLTADRDAYDIDEQCKGKDDVGDLDARGPGVGQAHLIRPTVTSLSVGCEKCYAEGL